MTTNIAQLLQNLNMSGIDETGLPLPHEEGFNSTKKNWATSDGTYWAIGDTCKTIPNGLYAPGHSEEIGYHLSTLKNDTDNIIDLPDSESENLLNEIKEFTTMAEAFKKHGFLYKRGVLLYGPPGSGKTVTIQQLIRLFTKSIDGIAVMCDHPQLLLGALRNFRKIESNRQILVVLEDLDALIDRYQESDFLNMLDGEAQLQNVVYVATTNYPELLDARFKDRPSRFDTIRKIGMPTEEARRHYLQVKLPDMDVTELVEGSDGYSVAYLRELIVLTQCFKLSTEDAFERLNYMRANLPDSADCKKGSFGFSTPKEKKNHRSLPTPHREYPRE